MPTPNRTNNHVPTAPAAPAAPVASRQIERDSLPAPRDLLGAFNQAAAEEQQEAYQEQLAQVTRNFGNMNMFSG